MDRGHLTKILSKNIAHCRGTATRHELAEWIGVSDGMIASMEAARAMPSLPTVLKLAEIFGVSVDDLLDPDLSLRHDKCLVTQEQEAPSLPALKERPVSDVNGLMTVADAAKELGVTRQRVLQLLKTYDVTTYRTNAQLLILREQFGRIPKVRKPGRRPYKDR
jgi:DNA-binding XRE family transcriptional regulator